MIRKKVIAACMIGFMFVFLFGCASVPDESGDSNNQNIESGDSFELGADNSNNMDDMGYKEVEISFGSVSSGDTVFFGNYEQDGNEGNGKEPIEWIVVSDGNDSVLLMSKYALDSVIYMTADDLVSEEYAETWEKSTIRKWLNEDFYNSAFSDYEKNQIVETVLENDPAHIASGDNTTTDKVFLIGLDEAVDIFDINKTEFFYDYGMFFDPDLVCEPTQYAINQGAVSEQITYEDCEKLRDNAYVTDFVSEEIVGKTGCLWYFRYSAKLKQANGEYINHESEFDTKAVNYRGDFYNPKCAYVTGMAVRPFIYVKR